MVVHTILESVPGHQATLGVTKGEVIAVSKEADVEVAGEEIPTSPWWVVLIRTFSTVLAGSF